MPATIITLSAFSADASTQLPTLDRDYYHALTMRTGGTAYEVLTVSRYQKKIDGKKKGIRVSLTAFSNNTGFYLHFARDTGTRLIILVRKDPVYIVEPGDDLEEYLLERFGIELGDLKEVLRSSDLMQASVKALKKLRRNLHAMAKTHVAEVDHLKYEIERRDHELAEQALYTRKLEAELMALRNEVRDYVV